MNNKPYYFVGNFGELGHENIAAGQTKPISGYPVFSTYTKENPNEKHNQARFVHCFDAIQWAEMKNNLQNLESSVK